MRPSALLRDHAGRARSGAGNTQRKAHSENVFSPARRWPGEHSAAVTEDERLEGEGVSSNSATPGVLVCRPLNWASNIGDLDSSCRKAFLEPTIMLSGRAEPGAETGPVISYETVRNLDIRLFDHPDEVISGAIPPPRFNLENLAALERHVHSLVLEQAALDYASNLEAFLTDRGELIENNAAELLKRLDKAAAGAKQRAGQIFEGLPNVSEEVA